MKAKKARRARSFLEQVQKLDKIIENKIIECDQWKAMATSATAQMGGERVQSSGSQQRMADAVEKYIDIERRINEYIDKLYDTKMEVLGVIEQLEVGEYDLLHKVYVQYISLAEVAVIYDRSYSSVTTTHGRALQHVEEILERIEDEKEHER